MTNDRVTLDDLWVIHEWVDEDEMVVARKSKLNLHEVLLDLGAIPIGTSLLLRADVLEETE